MNISYDVVIATRNRPDALALSIPSILRDQLRLPQKMIIVDSSDSHYLVQETISRIEKENNYKLIFLKSPKANLCFQRNLGLEEVSADVTVFPDDDSIFYPGALDEIIRIYEMDRDNLIAGVCAAEALSPPPGFPLQQVYKQNRRDTLKKKLGTIRYKIEHLLIPDPFHLIGKDLIARSPDAEWFNKENAIKVEYMTGFRMSFRSAIIKKVQFNNVFNGYCLAEDIDASFASYRDGALIGARNAQIYHHKFPAKRGDGFSVGLTHILNKCYVIAKHSNNTEYLRQTRKFIYYKLILYLVAAHSTFGRERIRGALFATRNISKLFLAKTSEQLDSSYLKILNEAVNGNSKN